jgi:hypothetical protein
MSGFQGGEVLVLLMFYFLQVWLQHLSKDFDSRSSCCLLLYPVSHLGSSHGMHFKEKNQWPKY